MSKGKSPEFRRKRDLHEPLLTTMAQVLPFLMRIFDNHWKPPRILGGWQKFTVNLVSHWFMRIRAPSALHQQIRILTLNGNSLMFSSFGDVYCGAVPGAKHCTARMLFLMHFIRSHVQSIAIPQVCDLVEFRAHA